MSDRYDEMKEKSDKTFFRVNIVFLSSLRPLRPEYAGRFHQSPILRTIHHVQKNMT